MPRHPETTWHLLVSGDELANAAKIRAKSHLEKSIEKHELKGYLDAGWEIKKEEKSKIKIIKKKPVGDSFEDELWTIFYKMGFKIMNSTNQFAISTSDEYDLGKQVDIIAIDDETCIFVECKEAVTEGTSHDFRQDISEFALIHPKLCNEISKKYPGRKFRSIFATKNYKLGDANRDLLRSVDLFYFDNASVEYYKSLSDYIGGASRYQLLSSLFARTTITDMNSSVPAIKGRMGGLDYYTFLMEPSRLLKLGYVLHRTNANNDFDELLPSYQRLIKKERLLSVKNFINNGGYFPNSLVVSIDSKEGLQFDALSSSDDSISVAGILHLPQAYQSMYIIDGQHRLYGYSESDYANINVIPVVAFLNLDKEEQLKLFFEINENQKAVTKTLRNILEIDIYDDSENPILRRKALLGRVSKKLGEDNKSAWYNKIAICEDAKCTITLEYVKAAFDKTNFFTKYKKNGSVIQEGYFNGLSNDEILDKFYPFFSKCLNYLAELCSAEWNTNNYLSTNNAAAALIEVIGDISSIVIDKDPSLVSDSKKCFEACKDMLFSLAVTLIDLSPENRKAIVNARGAAAKEISHRVIQIALHNNCPEFTNPDIEKYYVEHCINYNDKAEIELQSIRKTIINFIKSICDTDIKFYDHAGTSVEESIKIKMVQAEVENKRLGISSEPDLWEILDFNDINNIISNGRNWSELYSPWLSKAGFDGTKVGFVGIMKSFSDYCLKVKNGHHIPLTDYNTIHSIYEKIVEKEM